MTHSSPSGPDESSLSAGIRHALQPVVLLRSLGASAIIWLLMASAMPSYAGLIFHGKVSGYFAAGLAMVLVSEIVTVLITSIFSSDHATQVVPQSPTAVIQGLVAGSVVEALPADMPPEALFATVFLLVALSSALAGVFVALLGLTRAGGLIRYIPYPIVGGFMAGLGWLILGAGFSVLVGLRPNVASLPLLLESETFSHWLPAMTFALCVLGLRVRIKTTLVMPLGIVASLILFYFWAYVLVGDVSRVAEAGWLLPNVSNALHWTLPDPSAFAAISPAVVLASAGDVLTLIVVFTLNLFLRASAQEIIVKRELNLNHECIVNGVANVASAFSGGGVVAYHGPISVSLVEAMRVNGRLVGLLLACMFTLTLLVGGAVFSLIPRFIPAGLLMFFGLQFMKEWLVDSWSKLPRQDYLIVVIIALATAVLGLFPGIAVGIMVAISFFVLEYSRMDVIKQEFSGSFHRSNLDRSFAQNQLLQREGGKILILRLQGFIFFGTAYRFYEHVKARITAAAGDELRFIILDFKSVRGLDVSTIVDFQKLKQLMDGKGIELLVSSATPRLQPLLADGGIVVSRPDKPPLFDDLDRALEWCESILLREASQLDEERVTVERQLAQHAIIRPLDARAAGEFLEQIETKVGDTIFKQGDESDSLYFIESGRVDVLLQVEGERELRLRSMTAGAVIGEVGFYLGVARSASIVVTEAGVLQRLSHEALRQMEERAPQTASSIHVLIASMLSDRLSTTNRLVQELMD
ncbi:MAG: SulP family inorganic anion transporter [Chloroflexota bacterium]|nr:SulP family inorganic anion transporter [Chloroflexota bacterium]MDE2947826.1 SulP family inorganic anion transporter [Chloroflexota bacterium]